MPLAPFKGNRFNILFLNEAGVFYLTNDLKEFFNDIKEDNMLIKAVYHDLQVPHYLAACRALGLIDRFVTKPLWTLLEKKENVNNMDERYKEIMTKFQQYAEDSGDFMKGKCKKF